MLRLRIGVVAGWLALAALVLLGRAWWSSYQTAERLTLARHARLVVISDSGCVAIGLVWSPIATGQLPATRPVYRFRHEQFDSNLFRQMWRAPFGRFAHGWWLGDSYWMQHAEGIILPYWLVTMLVFFIPAGLVVKRCGDRAKRTAAQPPPRVCLRCGYDLSVTPTDSPCPECGLAAHRSVIDHIDPADCRPGWVRWIAVGSLLLLASYLVFGMYFVFAFTIPRDSKCGASTRWPG